MKVISKIIRDQRFWSVFLVCICAALILFGGLNFISSLRDDLAEQAVASVLSATELQQQAFDTFIAGDRERLHSFASYLSRTNSEDTGRIMDFLDIFSEVDAYYTVINLDSGTYCNNKSSGILQMDGADLESYRARTGSGVRNSYQSLYSVDMMFGYYECFTFADGTPGMFQKSYDSSKVSKEFSLSFYNGQGLGYVVTQDGDILLRSAVENGGTAFSNIFDVLNESHSSRPDLDNDVHTLVQALYSNDKGSATFQGADGSYVYTYVPLKNVSGWYMISLVPAAAVTHEAEGIILNSQATVIIAIIVTTIFLIVILLVLRHWKSIKEKNKIIQYREQQFDIFSTYLSNNTDDVYIMLNDRVDSVDYVSPSVERVLGISEEDVMADVSAFGKAHYASGSSVTIADLYQMEPGTSLEPMPTERVDAKTGVHKWFRETVYCVMLQDKKKYVVYLSDRTRERETQNTLTEALNMAQVANRAKSAFLSNVSHDIRTPMNAIIGLVTLLRQEADNPAHVIEYTQRINAASQHLLGLINDVLDINKIEGGTAALNITDLNLSDIIDEMNTVIRPQTKAKNQDFEIFATSFSHEHLLGDKLRINQILMNILSNAVKYTPEGGTIKMSVNELPQVMEDFSHIQFVIQDNGLGMSEEYLQVIFNPFSRELTAEKELIQGTGLGMAITKSLVDLMGGSIEVESALGKGSTFTVELQLRVQDADEVDPGFWEANGLRRMIVADDDEEVCRNVAKAMRNTGVMIDYATHGSQAVQMIRAAREEGHPYNLILLDWKMPDLDGLETARLIQKKNSPPVPIVLFSAYDWSDIQQEAIEAGVGHFLPKPFFLYTFQETIRRVMGGETDGPETPEKAGDVFQGKNILVVDDIEVNRMILVKILNTLGASCCTAADGQEAVDTFTASAPGEYDLIFMDVQMPRMNGYEATRVIRESSHPSARDIIIIAMTANAFLDDVRDALAAGMDAHVSKPIVLDQLKTVVQEVLERKGQQEAL